VGSGDACALSASGSVSCWGWNHYGEDGSGTTAEQDTPVPTLGLSDATSIEVAATIGCAVHATGTVSCWGDVDYGPPDYGATPVPLPGLTGITQVSVGNVHACVLHDDGAVACWGDDTWGELGNGTTASSLVPVQVEL
jgi:hypothetical protein